MCYLKSLALFVSMSAVFIFSQTSALAVTAEGFIYKGGYFNMSAPGKWEEVQNGQLAFRFIQTAANSEMVVLFDASRDITVQLTTTVARVFRGNKKIMDISGRWSWHEWRGGPGNNSIMIHRGGKDWDEIVNGVKIHSFITKNAGVRNEVELYDPSRGITVKLLPNKRIVSGATGVFFEQSGRFLR